MTGEKPPADSNPSRVSRRTVLAGAGTALLAGGAGCTNPLGYSRGATDVVLHNEADERRTVELTVMKPGNESAHIDSRLELEPNSRKRINNDVIMGNDYDVKVSFTDTTMNSPYTETQEWNDAEKALHIILNDQAVFAVQIG